MCNWLYDRVKDCHGCLEMLLHACSRLQSLMNTIIIKNAIERFRLCKKRYWKWYFLKYMHRGVNERVFALLIVDRRN